MFDRFTTALVCNLRQRAYNSIELVVKTEIPDHTMAPWQGGNLRSTSSRLKSAFFILALGTIFLGKLAHTEDLWSYRGEITNKGTRSEGFVGDLSYHNTSVPAKLSQIVTPIGEYAFKAYSGVPWTHRGWLKTSNLPIAAESNVVFDSSKPEEAHWYSGGKRPGTPGTWVYLPAYKYWLDPRVHAAVCGHGSQEHTRYGGLSDFLVASRQCAFLEQHA